MSLNNEKLFIIIGVLINLLYKHICYFSYNIKTYPSGKSPNPKKRRCISRRSSKYGIKVEVYNKYIRSFNNIYDRNSHFQEEEATGVLM
jgi:hypothetical protein